MSLSMSTATNVILLPRSAASRSHVGSSFAHGLHQSAPTVTTNHLPLKLFSLTGLPAASTATSSSAKRSPTLRTSAPAVADRVSVAARTRPKRIPLGRIGRLSIHRELFVDPHLDVLRRRHRTLVLAVVEEQGGRRVHTGGIALLLVVGDLRGGVVVGLLELCHVEAELLGVAGDGVVVVRRRLLEQLVVHLLELALRSWHPDAWTRSGTS